MSMFLPRARELAGMKFHLGAWIYPLQCSSMSNVFRNDAISCVGHLISTCKTDSNSGYLKLHSVHADPDCK